VNLAACGRLARGPLSGVWYRALELQFLSRPLDTRHSRNIPSRFSAGKYAVEPFDILYLCQHHVLTLWEVEAMYGSLEAGRMIPNSRCARAILNVEVQLQEIADLTQESEQKRLKTTVQELTGNWRGYLPRTPVTEQSPPVALAPTQWLGAALYSAGFEGFLTISAKQPERNLIVFPKNLKEGSWLKFRNPLTGRTRVLSGGKRFPRPKSP
jgi:hypothetical protein